MLGGASLGRLAFPPVPSDLFALALDALNLPFPTFFLRMTRH